ncbi:unnamed protein product, partial [Symbiodinium microadriaticum]
MLESKAAFHARAKEIGLNDAEIAVLASESHDTFGTFAFACNYVPGQADESALLELAARITSTDPAPAGRIPFIRRLVFESYTMAASDLRSRVERKDDDAPRKLAVAERAARHGEQVGRLKGLTLRGELEPSNALIDIVTQQVEDNQLKYVRWEQCTKRDQELMGIKSDPVWKPDSSGVIKEVKMPPDLKADLTSDLMLRWALQRRSLAYDQTRIIDYNLMEEWSQILLDAYVQVAPEGYAKVTIEQIHKADMELFKNMMRATRNGIKIQSDGTKPLEEAFRAAKVAPEVRLILQPLQSPSSSSLANKRKAPEPIELGAKASTTEEKLRRQVKNLQGQVKNLQTSNRGDNICFDYNLDGCDAAKPGIAISIENPSNSLLWQVPCIQRLARFTPIGSKDAAAYPPALCEAVAALVLRHKVEAGKQPRGSRHPPIISELIGCRWLPWGSQEPPKGTFKLDEATCARLAVPFPSKVLQWRLCEGRAEATADGVDVEMPADARYEVYVGTYRSCEQFVQEALQLEHPFDTDSSICDDLKIAVFELMTLGPSLLKLRREEVLRHYTERRTALQEQEQHLHSMLDEPRQRVIQDKQILLFNEMARDAGIQDPELFHAQVVGASLVGEQPHCPLFREVRRDAALSVEQLMLSAKWSREACHEKASDAATDAVLWEEAMQEVEAGWLQGPLSEQQVAEIVGPLFVVSPRFGLKQPDKVRAIDDLTSSLVNLAFASTSKLDLGGVDEIAVLARTMLECVQDDRTVILRLSDGTELRGELSLELDVAEARLIVGRTLDLESAYKQCLVAKTSLWASVLAIANPSGVRELFLSHALPFGACSSVYAFNRIARSLHVIGIRLFGLIWCNFYDDFPQLSLARSGNADVEVAEAFLGLIGWRFSRKERKRQPFRTSFDGLGVTFNFARSAEGFFEVSNKSGYVMLVHLAEQLRVRANLCPVAVFTDASLDVHESVGRVGGVVFVSRQTGQTPPTPMFFASDVPSKVLSRLQKDTKHVIAALEMMAVLIAVDLWGAFMSSKRCFFFVDNDSARGALIAAYSPSIQLNELVSVWNRLVIVGFEYLDRVRDYLRGFRAASLVFTLKEPVIK